jgi:3-oxoacyl-[acyl-carrier protein] reductase
MNKPSGLDNQVALVTGASRGIGRAIAIELAKRGAKVVGTATSESGAAAITEYLKAVRADAGHGAVLNVNDAEASNQLIDSISKEQGGLSVLVNNAGITQDQLAMRMKDEEWDAVIATNLTAVARLSRAVLRGMMKAKYGRIISITSVVGSAGNPGQMLAREIGSRNITVNCVAPGFIDTDMTKALNEQQVAALLQQIPAGRFGMPEDVAAAVAFLASAEAGYITGTTLHVNGGMYMSGG